MSEPAMSFQSLWNALVKRYSKWSNPDHEVTLTSRGLKKLLDTAYNEGHKKAEEEALSQLMFSTETYQRTTKLYKPKPQGGTAGLFGRIFKAFDAKTDNEKEY